MKLKMLVGMAGADFSLSPGDETERFSAGETKRMIEAGYAVPVREGKVEKAVKPAAPETASRPEPAPVVDPQPEDASAAAARQATQAADEAQKAAAAENTAPPAPEKPKAKAAAKPKAKR